MTKAIVSSRPVGHVRQVNGAINIHFAWSQITSASCDANNVLHPPRRRPACDVTLTSVEHRAEARRGGAVPAPAILGLKAGPVMSVSDQHRLGANGPSTHSDLARLVLLNHPRSILPRAQFGLLTLDSTFVSTNH